MGGAKCHAMRKHPVEELTFLETLFQKKIHQNWWMIDFSGPNKRFRLVDFSKTNIILQTWKLFEIWNIKIISEICWARKADKIKKNGTFWSFFHYRKVYKPSCAIKISSKCSSCQATSNGSFHSTFSQGWRAKNPRNCLHCEA